MTARLEVATDAVFEILDWHKDEASARESARRIVLAVLKAVGMAVMDGDAEREETAQWLERLSRISRAENMEEWCKRLRRAAALLRTPQPAGPAPGWRLVPIQATSEMLKAMNTSALGPTTGYWRRAYDAALAASPEPPAPKEGVWSADEMEPEHPAYGEGYLELCSVLFRDGGHMADRLIAEGGVKLCTKHALEALWKLMQQQDTNELVLAIDTKQAARLSEEFERIQHKIMEVCGLKRERL